MRTLSGRQAWALIAVVVITHELTAREGELLSHATDRGRAQHPILTNAAIIVTAAHLVRALPTKLDPYSGFGYALLTRIKGRTA